MKAITTKLAGAVLLLLLAAGCGGAGVGGSGTGYGLGYFGATAAQVCDSSLAAALECGGTATVGGSADEPGHEGTPLVHFADRERDASVHVAFTADAVELEMPCRALRFSGDFGISAVDGARFFGTYTEGADTREQPATLQVAQASGGSLTALSVTMRDAEGHVVLGPVLLQRVARGASTAC